MKKRRRRRSLAVRSRNRAWAALSKRLREEAGRCAVCGSDKRLNVHHLLWRRVRADLVLDENNLICLCAKHHFLLHRGHETEFMAWLRDNRPDQWEWVMRQAAAYSSFTSKP